jgi:hypothetical protein
MSFAGLGVDASQRKVLFRINPNKNNIKYLLIFVAVSVPLVVFISLWNITIMQRGKRKRDACGGGRCNMAHNRKNRTN